MLASVLFITRRGYFVRLYMPGFNFWAFCSLPLVSVSIFFLWHYHPIFITMALVFYYGILSLWHFITMTFYYYDCNLKSGNVIPPALFFFFEDWKTT